MVYWTSCLINSSFSIINLIFNYHKQIRMTQTTQTDLSLKNQNPALVPLTILNSNEIIQVCRQGSQSVSANLSSIIFSIANFLQQISKQKSESKNESQEGVKQEQKISESQKQKNGESNEQRESQLIFKEEIHNLKREIETQFANINNRMDNQTVNFEQKINEVLEHIKKQIQQESLKLANQINKDKESWEKEVKTIVQQAKIKEEKFEKKISQDIFTSLKKEKDIIKQESKQEQVNLAKEKQVINQSQMRSKISEKKEEQKEDVRPRKTQPIPILSTRKQSQKMEFQKSNKQQQKLSPIEEQQNPKHMRRQSQQIDSNLPILMAVDWVDPGYSHYKNLSLNKGKITPKQGQGFVFGKTKLKQQNQFMIKIDYMRKGIKLGIVDKKLKLFPVLPVNRSIIYYASDGHSWQGKQIKSKQGMRFKQGQTVAVCVDFTSSTISWKVEDQVRYSCVCDQLNEKNVDWMPYIYIGVGDCVKLIK